MTRRQSLRRGAAAGLLAAGLLAPTGAQGADPAPAATPPATPPAAQPAATTTSVPGAPNVPPEASQTIDQIMKDREALITGRRFTYDPGGRRDPFRSLIEESKKARAQRRQGIAGMAISEIDLVGIVHRPGGDI